VPNALVKKSALLSYIGSEVNAKLLSDIQSPDVLLQRRERKRAAQARYRNANRESLNLKAWKYRCVKESRVLMLGLIPILRQSRK